VICPGGQGDPAYQKASERIEGKDAMKQIAQNHKPGELAVIEVPAPACRPGGVLVQSLFSRSRGSQDKRQQQQIAHFVDAIRSGAPMPISLDSLVATTRATLAVGQSLSSGKPEEV
jgi:hypothetical protein